MLSLPSSCNPLTVRGIPGRKVNPSLPLSNVGDQRPQTNQSPVKNPESTDFEALALIGKYLHLQESEGVRFDFLQIERNVLS